MSLKIEASINASTFMLKLFGLMDYSTIDGFKLDIPENIDKIQIDFTNIDFIDSTGIGSLISIIYTAEERGLDVEFTGLNDSTRDLFETVGVFRIMEALLKGGL
ncbi:STAS domain-containing protein [Paenibacillus cremeus]|uniref:STAS domain-containing protein n=1 Tax=Paenibacillus cremeus TaxID=2163881 RepID=A0A559K7H6_9BACL|nr:STAS domain-containing protein [Paenibacillus cremeus]TVY08079.1 STAS domain-containing protein [Paenibacillus cremeus]